MENIHIKKRIWEIDFIRGIAFVLMAIDHLIYNIGMVFGPSWIISGKSAFLSKVAKIARDIRLYEGSSVLRIILISGVFLILSGVSSNFSKNNFKRGIRLWIISLALTLITFVLNVIMNDLGYRENVVIYFGILHCLSVSMILTPVFNKIKTSILFLLSLIIILVGFKLSNYTFDIPHFFAIFNFVSNDFASADFYPILPYTGLYMLGIVCGRILYKNKKSLFKKERNIRPLNYFGKNALWLYFIHQIILFILVFLIGYLFA